MKKILCMASLTLAVTLFTGGFSAVQAQKVKTEAAHTPSHKAKTTAIGAGAGAVTGAVVSKKKGKGALIGGAVGAGAGYLYGKHRDKTHPRSPKPASVKVKD